MCPDLFFLSVAHLHTIPYFGLNFSSIPSALKRICLLLAVACLFVCAYSQRNSELEFSRAVSQQRLQKDVRILVGFGNRQGGTASGDKAAAYFLREFKRMGLETEVLDDPERLTFTNVRWTLEVVSPRRLRGPLQHAWLAGFSPTSKKRTIRLVFVRSEGDVTKSNVDSAAVLVDLDNSARLYTRLADKGAVCLLTWAEPASKAYLDCAFIQNLPARDDNPIPVFDISRKAARSLSKRLGEGERVLVKIATETEIRKGKSKSVVAALAGKSKKYFIVCAHGDSDSGGPGADDNASGDAGVLELARVFSSMRHHRLIPVPDSSIKFIVWGSEYASTEQYVRSHSSELQDIVGVLNFDEIGTGASRNCLYFEGNDQRVNRNMLTVLQKVGEDYVGKKSFWHEATTNPSQGGTDSYVFLPHYLDRLGVPLAEIPSVTIYTAAWNEPKVLFQPKEWRTKAWKGPRDSVYIDYSLYYHSSMDIPATTTDRKPFDMSWGVKAVGIALLRMNWH